MKSKTLSDLVLELLGVNTFTRINPEVAAVGVTSITVVKANPNRLGLTIINLSANVLYLTPQSPASATNGIYLGANGGMLSLNYRDDLELVGQEWYGIATGAASAIHVLETVTQRE